MFADLPAYLEFLGASIVLLAIALTLYALITPHREITLIRAGNQAAAYSFSGTAIGMSIVLYATASGTFSVSELAAWGAVGLVGQLLVLFVVSLLIPALKKGLEEDRVAHGLLLGGLSIAMGVLNAGALST